MDANRLNFWLISKPNQWQAAADSGVEITARGSVRLTSQRSTAGANIEVSKALEIQAAERLKRVTGTRDRHGTWAVQDSDSLQIVASGAGAGTAPLLDIDSAAQALALGYDDVLYIVAGSMIIMNDRRARWGRVELQCQGFEPSCIAPGIPGGLWILDRGMREIAHLTGQPSASRNTTSRRENTFYPADPNPDAPRLELLQSPEWADDEHPVAMATHPDGRLTVLSWQADGSVSVRCLERSGDWSGPTHMKGAPFAHSLAWCDHDRIALLSAAVASEVPVYTLEPDATVSPLGDFYPLQEHDGGPFLTGLDTLPHYRQVGGSIRALRRLSLSTYASRGSVAGWAFQRPATASSKTATVDRWPLDSGRPETVWHRLYLEARIPAQCGVVIELAATNAPHVEIDEEDWHPHRFGEVEMARPADGTPCGAWVNADSELPFQTGLSNCPSEPHRCGLFTALVQRSNRPVRRLAGRFLHVRVTLTGNARATPEVFGVRIYASRHSYVDHYLPDLYSETRRGPDADTIVATTAPSTSADFLDRFLALFESVLTPLEDRIATSWLLTDPRTVPDESLEWLAAWVGINFDPLYPTHARRALLRAAPEISRSHGTLHGVSLLLDILTRGGVTQGRIVVLEDFRLRRTFATILGARLDDPENPLLAGVAASGNSLVGETLFLGEDDDLSGEFLSLFGTDLPDASQEQAIIEFFDRLAHRVTVLVHEDADAQELGLIERAVEREVPAHVVATVRTASAPFLTGASSLLGVHSSLKSEPLLEPVRIGSTQLGCGDRVLKAVSLDPRLEPGVIPQHAASRDSGQLYSLESGRSFALDATGDQIVDGEAIHKYVWKLI